MVFPARAGMSLKCVPLNEDELGFPRPRGDEPLSKVLGSCQLEFSPPARG